MKLLSIKDATDFLKVKESWLRMAIFKRAIPFIKVGRLIRFDQEQLINWLNSNKN